MFGEKEMFPKCVSIFCTILSGKRTYAYVIDEDAVPKQLVNIFWEDVDDVFSEKNQQIAQLFDELVATGKAVYIDSFETSSIAHQKQFVMGSFTRRFADF